MRTKASKNKIIMMDEGVKKKNEESGRRGGLYSNAKAAHYDYVKKAIVSHLGQHRKCHWQCTRRSVGELRAGSAKVWNRPSIKNQSLADNGNGPFHIDLTVV